MGPKAAMACTAAIEQVIDEHYTAQLDELGDSDPELTNLIARARDDEREHQATALAAGAEQAPAYPLLSGAIKLGCRLAIGLSTRI
jgi:ubiquinone biosynthesis monooxygenase Coq7